MTRADLTAYLAIRPEINTGDLLEWGSSTIIGKAIRFVTRKDVNHDSLALRFDRFDGLLNRRFCLEALEHGIELNLLSRRLENFKGQVYWYKLKPEYNNKRSAIAGWALKQVGVKYDYGSLFKNLLGRVSTDARRFFCSEYYFMALEAVGILKADKAPRPGEFKAFGIHEPRVQIF